MRILIAKDGVMIREGLARLIKSHTRHTVIGETSNEQEGLSLALRFKPDLVITGIRMPVMDGLQMIEALHGISLPIRAAILSGCSGFDYAKKTIRFGVNDYLLKPLAAEGIVDLLERIQRKMEAGEQKNAGTPGQCIKELIYGGPLSGEEDRRVRTVYGFGAFVHFQLCLGYAGDTPIGYEGKVSGKFDQTRALLPSVRPCVSWDRERRQFLGLATLPEDEDVSCPLCQAVKRKIVRPYKQGDGRMVWAMASMKGWESIQKGTRDVEPPIRKTLPVTEGDLVIRERMDAVDWKELRFPAGLGAGVKDTLCRGDPENVRKTGEIFMEFMKDGPCQEQRTWQTYLKATYLLLGTVREIGGDIYGQLQNADLLTRCTEVITLRELEQSYGDGLSLVYSSYRVEEGISNYAIKRAINYIREHYQEGISLEEVAGKLGITPEYLSTLFNREMGESFSTFLKKFRISHVKRLLKGTDIEIYEIVETVGCTDPKYFAGVFMDKLGISSGDYRQMGQA